MTDEKSVLRKIKILLKGAPELTAGDGTVLPE